MNRWTKAQDKVLNNSLAEFTNTHDAFRKASNLLGRTESACMGRYYTLRNKGSKRTSIIKKTSIISGESNRIISFDIKSVKIENNKVHISY